MIVVEIISCFNLLKMYVGIYSSVAQLVEQLTVNQLVAGSSPARGAKNWFYTISLYLLNLEKSKEGHMNVNYNFLVKVYSELTQDQKIKFGKNIQLSQPSITKVG